MRKPLERNDLLQLMGTHEIKKKAIEVIELFFDEFADVDCNDLMHVLMMEGNHIAALKNIRDNDRL